MSCRCTGWIADARFWTDRSPLKKEHLRWFTVFCYYQQRKRLLRSHREKKRKNKEPRKCKLKYSSASSHDHFTDDDQWILVILLHVRRCRWEVCSNGGRTDHYSFRRENWPRMMMRKDVSITRSINKRKRWQLNVEVRNAQAVNSGGGRGGSSCTNRTFNTRYTDIYRLAKTIVWFDTVDLTHTSKRKEERYKYWLSYHTRWLIPYVGIQAGGGGVTRRLKYSPSMSSPSSNSFLLRSCLFCFQP